MKTLNRPLRILLVEDSEDDACLMEIVLRRAGTDCFCHRVETPDQMSAALQSQEWDAIIADYVLPHFDGLAALAMVKERGFDLPFIIVSGHINEDTAVAAMKAGAHDYVMKDKLARLGPAIAREMREAEARKTHRAAEKELRKEQAFRSAIEISIPSGLTVVDLDGRQSYVNQAFCQMVGWKASELIDRKPPFDYWPLEERETITSALARVVQGQSPAGGLELRLCRKDGERFDTLMLVTPLRDSYDNITGWLSSVTDITQRKRAEETLRRSHEELEVRVRQRTADLSAANHELHAAMAELRRLEQELLEITDNERRRIGLNLHDDLGQKLTGVALMAKGLEVQLSRRGSDGVTEAARIHSLIRECLNQTRELSHMLSTLDIQEKDLASAMNELVLHVQRSFSIDCRFHCETPAPILDPQAVNQLYKITQEAVTNAVKHAKASKVDINISNGGDRIRLSIRNDGALFPSVVNSQAGLGLRIMGYRASLIGGSFEIKPGEKEGAVATCSLPIAHKQRLQPRSHA